MGDGVDNRLADGLTRWKEEQIPERLNAERPEIAWQVQELGDGERQMCSEILRGYAFGRVAASTRQTSEANWRMWVSWRSLVGKGCWLQKEMGEMELATELADFMGVLLRGEREQGDDNRG